MNNNFEIKSCQQIGLNVLRIDNSDFEIVYLYFNVFTSPFDGIYYDCVYSVLQIRTEDIRMKNSRENYKYNIKFFCAFYNVFIFEEWIYDCYFYGRKLTNRWPFTTAQVAKFNISIAIFAVPRCYFEFRKH